MTIERFEILVEEPSAEAFLRQLLPRILSATTTFEVYPYQGKTDLLRRLPERLQGYASWLPEGWRILVIMDRDDDEADSLRHAVQDFTTTCGLNPRSPDTEPPWQVASCIAIEELEAWFFGEWGAVREVYPRLPENTPMKAAYRDPDAIAGGTWEAFERELQRSGYFAGGLRKIEAARKIGDCFDPKRCSSRSFGELMLVLNEGLATA